ncbi:MAG TPA: hypothetical protein VM425_22200 [Myxococcota bacterium]|nr:hypothetical protein [Myxococcota bacterium]
MKDTSNEKTLAIHLGYVTMFFIGISIMNSHPEWYGYLTIIAAMLYAVVFLVYGIGNYRNNIRKKLENKSERKASDPDT